MMTSLHRSPRRRRRPQRLFPGGPLDRRRHQGSPVHQLGFRSGDKITHINGRDLTDDAQAMALYWSLGSSKVFKIRYERGGRAQVKTVRVV